MSIWSKKITRFWLRGWTPRTSKSCSPAICRRKIWLQRLRVYEFFAKWREIWLVHSLAVLQKWCYRFMILLRMGEKWGKADGDGNSHVDVMLCLCWSSLTPGPCCLSPLLSLSTRACQEYVRDCNLSLSVHATDFDDNFEGERVMNFMGNSRALGHDCYPEVNGCVSNQSRELLFSCISDHPVSTILTQEGNIKVSAQIAHTVDECPFNGNLLHGVTTVACYVGKLADLTTTPSPPETTTTTTHWSVAESFEKYPEWARKWLLEHPGMPLEDMPGYDSILNMSQFDGIPSPVGLEALPFRRNFSGLGAGEGAYGPYGPYGAYGNTNGEGDLGAGPLALSDGSNLNLQTGGFLRCAEKGCKTNVLLDFNRSLVSINKWKAQTPKLWLLRFTELELTVIWIKVSHFLGVFFVCFLSGCASGDFAGAPFSFGWIRQILTTWMGRWNLSRSRSLVKRLGIKPSVHSMGFLFAWHLSKLRRGHFCSRSKKKFLHSKTCSYNKEQ